jgi:phage tail-like protein
MADPFVNFNFRVEIDGVQRAAFQEVSGLESSIDVIEHAEGGDISSRKFPGRVRYTNILLRWGLALDDDLYTWHSQWRDGDPGAQRRDGSIVLLDRKGAEVKRWHFFRAWPAKFTLPAFNAEASDIAIASIELAHERLEQA